MNINLTIIITICSGITTVFGACAIIYRVFKKSIKSIAGEAIRDEMKKNNNSTDSQLSEIENSLKELQELVKDNDLQTKQALLSLIRERINQIHQEYVPLKWIGAHTLFVVEELYTMYKKLGGNSFIDRQMQDIRALNVVSAEEEISLKNSFTK